MVDIVKSTELLLQNFDPSLLQNVILGMLALLVPVGVGILSFFFQERSKGNIASNLELFILLKTVLKADKIVIFSFIGLFLLSLYYVNISLGILGISFFGFYIIWILSTPFKNIWKWFLENTKDFSIIFLKNLDIKKDKNIILSSWQALWLGKGQKEREREFTQIFVSHIDDAIKYKKFNLAIELSRTYISNIGKRNVFIMGDKILPKIFEWNEVLWNYEQDEDKSYHKRKKIEKKWQKKYIPKFLKKQRLKIFDKKSTKKYDFWNFNYYSREFLPEIVKFLLQDGQGLWQLFDVFKKYIEDCERKLKELESEDEKKDYQQFIINIFNNFCPVFFDEVGSAPSSYDIWHHHFPKEWKITSDNFENTSSRIIFDEVIKWSENKLFTEDEKPSFDGSLSDVMSGLFPNVQSELFTAFLKLYSEFDLESALRKKSNFIFIGVSISWSGSADVDDDVMNREMDKMMQEKDISQQEDTVQVIFKYFRHKWGKLKIMLDDNNKEEWNKSNEKQRHNMLQNAQKKNMSELKKKLESEEIKKVCVKEKYMESNRQSFLRLINLLLKEIDKK